MCVCLFFFFNDTATTEIYTLSLHDALPIWGWEATDPDLFPDTIWEDTKAIYLDDRYEIGVSEFLDEEANLPVQANMIAIMLVRSEEHTSELQSLTNLVCRLLLEKKKQNKRTGIHHSTHMAI